jgi:enoyl-CoA hydratase/carnithine racemase
MTIGPLETIALARDEDGVAVVTLDRPAHGNAVDDRMHSELATVFRRLRGDKQVRAIVLTGAGEQFCVGGDSSPSRRFETFTGLTPIEEAQQIVDTFLALDQPVACAVNGDALGLGAILATLADVAFIAAAARFGDAHVRGGVTAGNGSSAIWPLLIGVNRAKKLLLGGELLSATEAVDVGLLNAVVDDGAAARAAALAQAQAWAALPAFAVQTTKRAMNVHLKAAVAQVMPLALALEEQSLQHPDFIAARAARNAAAAAPAAAPQGAVR